MKDPRYDGKPMLRLVELWVLWAGAADEARLKAMEPGFHKTWRHDGSWYEMIEAVLNLPASLPDQLREIWQHNLDVARKEGVPPPKEMFARSIADQISGDKD